MDKFENVMVDIETGGLSPDRNPILQIGAMRFDLRTCTIDTEHVFLMNVQATADREFDDETIKWWTETPEKKATYAAICKDASPAHDVMLALADWGAKNFSPYFWSKHIMTDYSFIESYFKDQKVHNPWSYHKVTDMDSFLHGWFRLGGCPVDPQSIPSLGAHNALNDCLWQIQYLFAAVKGQN